MHPGRFRMQAFPGRGTVPRSWPPPGFPVLSALAGFAADIATIIPLELLLALAGLAVIRVLSMALQQMSAGPLTFRPLHDAPGSFDPA